VIGEATRMLCGDSFKACKRNEHVSRLEFDPHAGRKKGEQRWSET